VRRDHRVEIRVSNPIRKSTLMTATSRRRTQGEDGAGIVV
jgi:hypothetical protein